MRKTQMAEEHKFTLHRRKPDESEDRMVDSGSKADMLRRFAEQPQALRPQFSMMDGSLQLNHLEIGNMLRLESDRSDE
jgi:hypothetical protein